MISMCGAFLFPFTQPTLCLCLEAVMSCADDPLLPSSLDLSMGGEASMSRFCFLRFSIDELIPRRHVAIANVEYDYSCFVHVFVCLVDIV